MNIQDIKQNIRYITNERGKPTDVLIPLELWENILSLLSPEEAIADSREEIIADLQQSFLDGKAGKTFPLEQLWESIEK